MLPFGFKIGTKGVAQGENLGTFSIIPVASSLSSSSSTCLQTARGIGLGFTHLGVTLPLL